MVMPSVRRREKKVTSVKAPKYRTAFAALPQCPEMILLKISFFNCVVRNKEKAFIFAARKIQIRPV